MTYSKDQLKKWSGGDKVRTTYKVPTIKFNGNTGIFTKFPVGDYKNGEEIKDIELTIMRARRSFSSFEKIDKTNSIRCFTNEHDSYNDHITVFEARTGQNIKVIGSGIIEQLRNELPNLRINSNLYCLYEDEVYKLVVKGKSRQSLVDKKKELAKNGKEFFEKKFKLVPQEEAGQGGNTYYFLKYEDAGDSDLEKVGPHMEDIAKVMATIDEEYAETNERLRKDAGVSTGEQNVEEEDIVSVDSANTTDASDEIKVEDIPF